MVENVDRKFYNWNIPNSVATKLGQILLSCDRCCCCQTATNGVIYEQ